MTLVTIVAVSPDPMGGNNEAGMTRLSLVSVYSVGDRGLESSVMERRVRASASPSRIRSLEPD